MSVPSGRPIRSLVGGIVAYNDGPRVGRAIRSLLGQRLPPGVSWNRIWVVVAPDGAGTLEAARAWERRDPRVRVVAELARRGKSAALGEVFRRAEGDVLVLLNGDAIAEAHAVAELLRTARGARTPWGVMARPCVPPSATGAMGDSYRLLWEMHHRLHRALYRRTERTHLSDELLALSVDRLPSIPSGIVNDGSFLGAALRTAGGEMRYAERAFVRLSVPATFGDHVAQRRRIAVGHRQVYESSLMPEGTLLGLARRDPAAAVRVVLGARRRVAHGARSLVILSAAELMAQALGRWDRVRGTSDPSVWTRVGLAVTEPASDSGPHPVPG